MGLEPDRPRSTVPHGPPGVMWIHGNDTSKASSVSDTRQVTGQWLSASSVSSFCNKGFSGMRKAGVGLEGSFWGTSANVETQKPEGGGHQEKKCEWDGF